MKNSDYISYKSKGRVIIPIVLIFLILGVNGYLAYNKYIVKSNMINTTKNSTNTANNYMQGSNDDAVKIDGLRSISYSNCDKTKNTISISTMQKILDVINTKTQVETSGLNDACLPTLALDYGKDVITITFVNTNIIKFNNLADDQLYQISSTSSNPRDYIVSLFN